MKGGICPPVASGSSRWQQSSCRQPLDTTAVLLGVASVPLFCQAVLLAAILQGVAIVPSSTIVIPSAVAIVLQDDPKSWHGINLLHLTRQVRDRSSGTMALLSQLKLTLVFLPRITKSPMGPCIILKNFHCKYNTSF